MDKQGGQKIMSKRKASSSHTMLRVDHAGEYGAAQIYAGQLAVMGTRHPYASEIRRMADQEQQHLDVFSKMLVEGHVRPTILQPLWKHAGFALGVVTALMGPRAAMACTVAVEDVIEKHYAHQLDELGDKDLVLAETITTFRNDELDHKETALEHEAEQTFGYPLLAAAIKTGCRLAIQLSKRF